MLNRIQKIVFISILNCFVFSQMQTWHTTRFEKFWYSKVHNMKFRSPFVLMPFNIKVGYMKYGGTEYWEQWEKAILNNEEYNSNPIVLDIGIADNWFEDINKTKNRTLLVSEIDLMKYNFFSKKQNIIDVQFGLGYKFMKALQGFSHGNTDKYFKPEIHEYNVNSNFILQFNESKYYNLYYSIGYATADLYDSNDGQALGHGLSESFGFGVYFLRERDSKKSNAHHGFEIKFNKLNINHISDPLSIIKAFNIEQVGLMYSYGIGYGGSKTLGDEAYSDLLNDDFISAVEKFQHFKAINTVSSKSEVIDEIIAFGLEQIPYQMYDKAMEDYKDGYLEQALWWLNKAFLLSDDYLKEKINQRKIIIISELLKGDFNNKSINNQIDIINNLKAYDENNTNLNNKLSSLFIKKGNFYLKNNNFFDSYFFYKEAIILNPDNEVVVKQNFKNYIVEILHLAYKYLQNNDYVLAYEMLSLISEFANESEATKALSDIAYKSIDDDNVAALRKRMQNILYLDDDLDLGISNIHLGQNYFIIVDLLGHPIEKVTKRRFENIYDFATFKIADLDYVLFFKNKVLIDIERPK